MMDTLDRQQVELHRRYLRLKKAILKDTSPSRYIRIIRDMQRLDRQIYGER